MSLDYYRIDRFDKVLRIQDIYTQWHLDVVCSLLKKQEMEIPFPPSVLDIVPEELKKICPPDVLLGLAQKNKQLLDFVLDAEKLDEYMQVFAVFLEELQSFRTYLFLQENGMDEVSGLKNSTAMQSDMQMEMKRLSRQGQVFSVGLARINDYDQIKQQEGEERALEFVRAAANVIIESMRPSDDAYYASENEFVLCMRQTDMAGGIKAFQRFEQLIEQTDMYFGQEGNRKKMTMVCCIAEPVDGDDFAELLANLRHDIKNIDHDEGSAFSFQELSPLQRYIESQ